MKLTVTDYELEYTSPSGEICSVLVTFEITAKMHYAPAQLGRPLDQCTPDESEHEVTDVEIVDTFDTDRDESVPASHLPAIRARLLTLDFAERLWDAFYAEQGE